MSFADRVLNTTTLSNRFMNSGENYARRGAELAELAGFQMPVVKTTQCITKEQAANPNSMVPPRPQRGGAADNSDCAVTDQKITGKRSPST